MNTLNKNKSVFSVDVHGICLKVLRVGNNPRLNMQTTFAKDPRLLRGIHSHFTYEVFFVTRGTLELVTAQKTTVYERKIVIIPPKLKHYGASYSNNSFCLLFSFENLKRTAAVNIVQRQKQCEERLTDICELPLSDEMAFYIQKIAEKSAEGTAFAERSAELLTALVFHEIIHLLLPQAENQISLQSGGKHIGAIESYINANLQTKITLRDVAAHVFLSTRQVSRILAKEYGCSLATLLTEKRLATAEMLVKNTDMKIADIAAQTQIGSANYFYTLFKQKYGVTPLQYRKANQKGIT